MIACCITEGCVYYIKTWVAYQEVCFYSLEHSTLHVDACHSVLADHTQAVAYCHCLFQPVAPAKCALLQQLKLTLLHWQDAVQFCLHCTAMYSHYAMAVIYNMMTGVFCFSCRMQLVEGKWLDAQRF